MIYFIQNQIKYFRKHIRICVLLYRRFKGSTKINIRKIPNITNVRTNILKKLNNMGDKTL